MRERRRPGAETVLLQVGFALFRICAHVTCRHEVSAAACASGLPQS